MRPKESSVICPLCGANPAVYVQQGRLGVWVPGVRDGRRYQRTRCANLGYGRGRSCRSRTCGGVYQRHCLRSWLTTGDKEDSSSDSDWWCRPAPSSDTTMCESSEDSRQQSETGRIQEEGASDTTISDDGTTSEYSDYEFQDAMELEGTVCRRSSRQLVLEDSKSDLSATEKSTADCRCLFATSSFSCGSSIASKEQSYDVSAGAVGNKLGIG